MVQIGRMYVYRDKRGRAEIMFTVIKGAGQHITQIGDTEQPNLGHTNMPRYSSIQEVLLGSSIDFAGILMTSFSDQSYEDGTSFSCLHINVPCGSRFFNAIFIT